MSTLSQLPDYVTVLEEVANGFCPEKGLNAYVAVRDRENGRLVSRAGIDLDDAMSRVRSAVLGDYSRDEEV